VAKKGKKRTGGSSEGPSTDAENSPVFDPSTNVKELVSAEVRRIDDLRAQSEAHTCERIDSVEKHAHEVAELRAKYDDRLRDKETERIDAIRQVDVNTGQRSAEVAAEAVKALAAQVPVIAEAARGTLATTIEPILKSIAELQRAQYELQGQKTGGAESKDTAAELATAIGSQMSPMVLAITKQGEVLESLIEMQNRNAGGETERVASEVAKGRAATLRVAMISAAIAGSLLLLTIVGFIAAYAAKP